MKNIYLINYSVKGIKSLDEDVKLSFYKKTISKDPDMHGYNIKGIYGMNGSGKSGIVTSVKILKNILTDPGYLNNPIIQKNLDSIINKKTGKNKEDTNLVTCTVEYSSKFTNPNITVSLYRRDYSEEYSQNYTLVDLQDYVSDNLVTTNKEKEYLVSDSPKAIMTNNYTLKENLKTGTYKIVYKLYDEETYVGEAFDYIIIK